MLAVLSQPIFLLLIQPIVLILWYKTSDFLPNFISQIIKKLLNWYLMLLKNQNQMPPITRWIICNKQVQRFIEMAATEPRSSNITSQLSKRADTCHLIKWTLCDCWTILLQKVLIRGWWQLEISNWIRLDRRRQHSIIRMKKSLLVKMYRGLCCQMKRASSTIC